MTVRLTLFWQLLRRAGESPSNLTAALASLPPAGQLSSPWEVWLLFCLVRHRRRQLWVGEVVSTRLRGDPLLLAQAGALGHPQEIPQSGLVPGLPEWEYYFHGRGCCLTHRVTGESIDVDFYGDSSEYFDLWFYVNYLRSLKQPEPPEARLIGLHPSWDPLALAYAQLREAGLLIPFEDRHVCCLSDEVLDHEDDIDRFCLAWASGQQHVWLAALIGDWLPAQEAAASCAEQTLTELTRERASHTRSLRHDQLRAAFDRGDHDSRNALLGLADLAADDLDDCLAMALEREPTGTTSAALSIIQRSPRRRWVPCLRKLLRRIDPAAQAPQPYIWKECVVILLEEPSCAHEMEDELLRAGGTEIAEAALLALEHAPRHALPLFRRALRSHIPHTRTVAAAILALIDRPWSRRELLAVLESSTEQAPTAECRAGLLETHDAEAHRRVQEWEERNPHEPEMGRFITIGEAMLRDRARFIRWEMEQLHDRVMKVRDCEPPEPPARPWWKLWGQ